MLLAEITLRRCLLRRRQQPTPTPPTPRYVCTPAPPPFVPTGTQEDVLAALAGKALRTDALAAKADVNRRTLFRQRGGLPELREHGLVDWHPRLGYFRPDALPPELRRVA